MLKKIDIKGKTSFEQLYQVLKFGSHEDLMARKARLFPTGNSESELSTTSIFLASLCAVKEYREKLLSEINIKKITNKNVELHAFTEISNNSKENRPDGLLVVTSGKSPIIEWAAFVEVKVGNNTLESKQIERYTDFARDIGINDLITISNELVTSPLDSPVTVKKRKFDLFHWSWSYLKIEASRLVRIGGVEDTDHIFILTELRRYLDNHSKVSNFISMGKDWKEVTQKIHGYSPDQKVNSDISNTILDAYVQEEKDISLQLTDKSSSHIELMAKGDRREALEKQLQDKKVLKSTFIIDKNKDFTFDVSVDFIRQSISCSTKVVIDTGKAVSQTSSLIKKLEGVSGYTDNIFIKAYYIRNKCNEACSLEQLIRLKEHKEPYPIVEKSYGDTIKHFTIKTVDSLGSRNFTGNKNFIVNLEEVAYRFLTQVMENL